MRTSSCITCNLANPRDTQNVPRLPKLKEEKKFELWKIYVIKLLGSSGVPNRLTSSQSNETASNNVLMRKERDDESTSHILFFV